MLLKVGENVLSVKQLESGRDGELLAVSSGSKLFAYDTIVVLGGLCVYLLITMIQNGTLEKVHLHHLNNGNIWQYFRKSTVKSR